MAVCALLWMSRTYPEKNWRSLFNVCEYNNGTHKRHFPSWMNFSCQSTSCINQISAWTSSQDHCFSTVAVFKCLVQTLFTRWLETSEGYQKHLKDSVYYMTCIQYDVSSRRFDLHVLLNLTFSPPLKYHQHTQWLYLIMYINTRQTLLKIQLLY